MGDFKLCSDGEFLPLSIPCPPPFSGPYYFYPSDNLPSPPSSNGGIPISSGAVAGIIISGGFIFFVLCLVALKCRARFILGSYGSHARNRADHLAAGDQLLTSSDQENMVFNIAGCGLEERLVNLLPVYEYVGLMKGGKMEGNERQQECAVCLCLFEEKEPVRVLPKCHHVFHIQCIDKWFESHANCPLCRERITLQTIQLSLIRYSSCKPDHDQNQRALISPQHLAHDHDPSHPPPSVHDERAYGSSSSKDLGLHADHQRLAGDLQHQNFLFTSPSARLIINNRQPALKAVDQPRATPAAHGHLAADDDQGQLQKEAAIYTRSDQLFQSRTLNAPAGHHEAAPTRASSRARQSSLLRKSLSTGSMNIDQSDDKARSTHSLVHSRARLARSSTRVLP